MTPTETSVAPETNTNEQEDDKENKNAEVTKDVGDGVLLKLDSFDEGKYEGFTFWKTAFKTLDSAVSHFTKLSKGGKKGEDVILGVFNRALSFRFRSQANQALTSKKLNPTQLAEQFKLNPCIISETDALEYMPGEREVDSISGLRRQANELTKMAKKLKEEGKIDLAKEKLKQYYDIKKLIDAKVAAEEAELLQLLETT